MKETGQRGIVPLDCYTWPSCPALRCSGDQLPRAPLGQRCAGEAPLCCVE